MTVVAITGHRPERIKDPAAVIAVLTHGLTRLQPELLYQGMAAGVDLWSARIAQELRIPYVAARPWAGHTARVEDRAAYAYALQQAAEVVDVSPSTEYLGPWQYHKRNEYMVDRADTVVAVWDGEARGGTAACVRYAQKLGRRIIVIDPQTNVARNLT